MGLQSMRRAAALVVFSRPHQTGVKHHGEENSTTKGWELFAEGFGQGKEADPVEEARGFRRFDQARRRRSGVRPKK
jgi:hypothetical protein